MITPEPLTPLSLKPLITPESPTSKGAQGFLVKMKTSPVDLGLGFFFLKGPCSSLQKALGFRVSRV